MARYVAVNSAVYIEFPNGERDLVAVAPPAHIDNVVGLLNQAAHAQDTRRYTASARLYARAEGVPGFAWAEGA